MVMIMNKNGFIKELQSKLNYNEEQCIIINDIIEATYLLGKKNKTKMINDFIDKLGVSSSEANKIYEVSMNIILSEMKNKINGHLKVKIRKNKIKLSSN